MSKSAKPRSKQSLAPVVELPRDAPALSLRLLELATMLRQPHADRLHCANELDALAATLESFDFQLLQLERLRDQLGGCLGENAHDNPRDGDQRTMGEMLPDSLEISHLRPDKEGRYAWDRWEARAVAAGVEPGLAQLGRAVMREAAQHDWSPRLRGECGWNDQGRAMIALAQHDAQAAEERWDYLLNTDGGRGRWTEQGEWQPFDR